jgi:hypothetical protein
MVQDIMGKMSPPQENSYLLRVEHNILSEAFAIVSSFPRYIDSYMFCFVLFFLIVMLSAPKVFDFVVRIKNEKGNLMICFLSGFSIRSICLLIF